MSGATVDFRRQRRDMVKNQLMRRGINDPLVLAAMGSVPRESFVSTEYHHLAYKDSPLPIGYGQTISQPYIVAYMIQAMEIQNPAEASVLEIGTGLGYEAAVLSKFTRHVYTVERVPELAAQAEQNLLALNYTNISVSRGDGGYGWQKYAPYDAIIVAAASPEIPPPLVAQLKPGALLVIPVGKPGKQKLWRVRRTFGNRILREPLIPVAFVPLLGEHGYREQPSRS